jgi:hypothetical protein
MAELTKVQNKALEIGLEPGLYRIVLQRGDYFYRAEVLLSQDRRSSLRLADFIPTAASPAVTRGDTNPSGGPGGDEVYPKEAFKFQLIPNMWLGKQGEKTLNNMLFGLVAADGWDLKGLGLGIIGVSNYRNVDGVQLAGIYATTAGNLRGFQGAGILNFGNGIEGAQLAGIGNINNGRLLGFQDAFIGNITLENVRGFQGAGIFNFSGGSVKGFQGAGIGNLSVEHVSGFQGAGIFNFTAGNVDGLQAAGILNWAMDSLNGLQLGMVNLSGEGGRGVQIGLVNLSENENVIPIGLVNIVKGGILNPSIYLDSYGFMNLGLKSGSKNIYSVLSAGLRGIPLGGDTKLTLADPDDENLFVSRIGLGVEIPLGKFFFDIEALCGDIIETGRIGEKYSAGDNTLLIQGRLIGGYKFFKHLGVFAGISYDFFHAFNNHSPIPGGSLNLGLGDDWNVHRIGFFGGVQF